MNPGEYQPRGLSLRAGKQLGWVVALVAVGMVVAAAALAFDLHEQQRRLQNISDQLKHTDGLRELQGNSAAARYSTAQAALVRRRQLANEREADLKRLGETYTQREATAKQVAEVQEKFQALAKDLLDLAKTDPDAREIVRKYNIQQTSPAPAATPAKP